MSTNRNQCNTFHSVQCRATAPSQRFPSLRSKASFLNSYLIGMSIQHFHLFFLPWLPSSLSFQVPFPPVAISLQFSSRALLPAHTLLLLFLIFYLFPLLCWPSTSPLVRLANFCELTHLHELWTDNLFAAVDSKQAEHILGGGPHGTADPHSLPSVFFILYLFFLLPSVFCIV